MTPIEQIKEKIDIVEFIRGYVELKSAGKNFKANCPFHKEKTPSFMVSPERQTWHCFGSCSEGGDIFKFLMKYENIEFYEALKILAEKAGVELKKISPTDQKQFGVLYDINESAKKFFQSKLQHNTKAKKYLEERGLINKTIEEFEIGFAPGGYEELTLDLINLGYDIKDIERAGLNFKSDRGGYIDRFRNRIMFPIYNHFGKVIGFSGRILPEYDNGETGKYINSPETPIFNKSRVLYGFHKAKNFIHKENKCLLVEGQMDFLMLWQDGVNYTTATSGTALTEDHLQTIHRQTDNLIFCFDNDEAGLKAAERSIDMANEMDFSVNVLILKDYKDPAEAVEKNPGKMEEIIKTAVPVMEFYFMRYHKENDADLKIGARLVLDKLKKISSPVERNFWLKKFSEKTGISEQALMEEMQALKTFSATTFKKTEKSEPLVKTPQSRLELISERIIILFLLDGQFKQAIEKTLEFMAEPYQKIFQNLTEGRKDFEKLIIEKANFLSLKASAEKEDMTEEKLKKELLELLKQVKQEYCKNKQCEIILKIKEAEKNDDQKNLGELLKQFDETSKILQNIK